MDVPESCPKCAQVNVYPDGALWVCADCGYEWSPEANLEGAQPGENDVRLVRDSNGNVLADGDTVILIKSLKLKGSSVMLKQGTKITKIRLADGDHEVDCRVDNMNVMLKAEFLRKV